MVVGVRAGAPQGSACNEAFGSAIRQGATLVDAHPVIAPDDGEVVVVKRRVSAA